MTIQLQLHCTINSTHIDEEIKNLKPHLQRTVFQDHLPVRSPLLGFYSLVTRMLRSSTSLELHSCPRKVKSCFRNTSLTNTGRGPVKAAAPVIFTERRRHVFGRQFFPATNVYKSNHPESCFTEEELRLFLKESYEELGRLKFKSSLFLSHQEMFTFLQAFKILHSSIYCIQ